MMSQAWKCLNTPMRINLISDLLVCGVAAAASLCLAEPPGSATTISAQVGDDTVAESSIGSGETGSRSVQVRHDGSYAGVEIEKNPEGETRMKLNWGTEADEDGAACNYSLEIVGPREVTVEVKEGEAKVTMDDLCSLLDRWVDHNEKVIAVLRRLRENPEKASEGRAELYRLFDEMSMLATESGALSKKAELQGVNFADDPRYAEVMVSYRHRTICQSAMADHLLNSLSGMEKGLTLSSSFVAGIKQESLRYPDTAQKTLEYRQKANAAATAALELLEQVTDSASAQERLPQIAALLDEVSYVGRVLKAYAENDPEGSSRVPAAEVTPQSLLGAKAAELTAKKCFGCEPLEKCLAPYAGEAGQNEAGN